MSDDAKHFSVGPTRYLWQDPDTGEVYEIPEWAARHAIGSDDIEVRVVAVDGERGTITLESKRIV